MQQFNAKVKEATEFILDKFIKLENPLVMAVYPVIRMGKKALYGMLEENPKEVYEWLKIAKEKIDEAIKVYDDENR